MFGRFFGGMGRQGVLSIVYSVTECAHGARVCSSRRACNKGKKYEKGGE